MFFAEVVVRNIEHRLLIASVFSNDVLVKQGDNIGLRLVTCVNLLVTIR